MKIQLKTPIGGGKSLFYSTNWFKTACRFRCKSLVSHTQTLVPVFLRQKHLRPLNLHLSRPSHARNSESCICMSQYKYQYLSVFETLCFHSLRSGSQNLVCQLRFQKDNTV